MLKQANQIFQYNGSPITFQKGDSVMVNATQMAKPFGKRTSDWLSNQQTDALIYSLSAKTGIPATGLVIVNQGGNNQGTWMHEDLALIFAQWLSPEFYLWCNDRIKELLTTGVATVSNDDETIANAMAILQKRLNDSKQRVQMLEGENEHLTNEVKQLAPKAQYTDDVLQSPSTYTMTQMAKELNFTSAAAFLKRMVEEKILFRQSGQYQLMAKYAGNGYTTTRTARFFHKDGTPDASTSTVWTERGRVFLHTKIGLQAAAAHSLKQLNYQNA